VLFLDRDGVVIEDRHYLADPSEVVLLPGAAAAMVRARAAGFRLVGVSNQSGIGRGRFSEADFSAVMSRMVRLLADAGAAFDAFVYCPHAPDADCACRKPRPGMLDAVRGHVPWLPGRSWVIGDKESDVALARGAGLGAVHVATGHGAAEAERVRAAWADDPAVHTAPDLEAAVALVLVNDPSRRP